MVGGGRYLHQQIASIDAPCGKEAEECEYWSVAQQDHAETSIALTTSTTLFFAATIHCGAVGNYTAATFFADVEYGSFDLFVCGHWSLSGRGYKTPSPLQGGVWTFFPPKERVVVGGVNGQMAA